MRWFRFSVCVFVDMERGSDMTTGSCGLRIESEIGLGNGRWPGQWHSDGVDVRVRTAVIPSRG